MRTRRARSADGQALTPVTRALYRLMQESIAALVAAALEAELQEFLRVHAALRSADGARAIVRNGYLPPRTILTHVGEIPVRVPRTRDRREAGIAFSSALLPPYLSRSQLNAQLPHVFLRSCLDGDAGTLLQAVLGNQIIDVAEPILDAAQAAWSEQCLRWRRPAPDGGAWLFWWAGSVPDLAAKGELLFVTGLHHDGRHALVLVARADDTSAWPDLLGQLRAQDARNGAKLCEADPNPDIWQALKRHFPDTLVVGHEGPGSEALASSARGRFFRSYP